MRSISKVAPGWWDYTTLDREILDDAARLTVKDLEQLGRPPNNPETAFRLLIAKSDFLSFGL